MADKIDIKVNIPKDLINSPSLNRALKEGLGQGTQIATGEMLKRTQQGKDVNNRPFARRQYSKQHKETRQNRGLPTSPVDHFFTGAMLRTINSQVKSATPESIKTRVFGAASQSIKIFNTNKLRNWFGFGNREVKRIREAILRKINSVIK